MGPSFSPISPKPKSLLPETEVKSTQPSSIDFLPEEKTAEDQDKRLFRRMIEVDLGLHLLTVLAVIVIVLVALVLNQRLKEAGSSEVVGKAGSIVVPHQPAVAGRIDQPAVFISGQVLLIDKAFNSEPIQIKLTVNGQLKKEVFGYLPYWVVPDADQINTSLLTSVSYFGLEVDGGGNIMKNSPNDPQVSGAWQEWESDPKLTTFMRKLKQQRIKTLVTFKMFNNSDIEQLVTSPQASQNFINNALYQVSAKALDGVNIDFEYVGTPSDQVRDKFTILMGDLNKALKAQYPKSILTIATYADSATVDQFFDVQLLAQYCNGLVIMGYDFSTPNSPASGAIAPMGGYGENLSAMLSAYLDKVSPDKLILAVPYYGYDWTTKDRIENAPVIGGGSVNILTYAEIMDAAQRINVNWDDASQTPWYSYVDKSGQDHVVHFENTRSLGIKYDLINAKKLQGVGIWALGFDGRNTDLDQLLADKFANQ